MIPDPSTVEFESVEWRFHDFRDIPNPDYPEHGHCKECGEFVFVSSNVNCCTVGVMKGIRCSQGHLLCEWGPWLVKRTKLYQEAT